MTKYGNSSQSGGNDFKKNIKRMGKRMLATMEKNKIFVSI